MLNSFIGYLEIFPDSLLQLFLTLFTFLIMFILDEIARVTSILHIVIFFRRSYGLKAGIDSTFSELSAFFRFLHS